MHSCCTVTWRLLDSNILVGLFALICIGSQLDVGAFSQKRGMREHRFFARPDYAITLSANSQLRMLEACFRVAQPLFGGGAKLLGKLYGAFLF